MWTRKRILYLLSVRMNPMYFPPWIMLCQWWRFPAELPKRSVWLLLLSVSIYWLIHWERSHRSWPGWENLTLQKIRSWISFLKARMRPDLWHIPYVKFRRSLAKWCQNWRGRARDCIPPQIILARMPLWQLGL